MIAGRILVVFLVCILPGNIFVDRLEGVDHQIREIKFTQEGFEFLIYDLDSRVNELEDRCGPG